MNSFCKTAEPVVSFVDKLNVSISEFPGFSSLRNSSQNLFVTVRDHVSIDNATSPSTYATSFRKWHKMERHGWDATWSTLNAWNTSSYLQNGLTPAATTLGKVFTSRNDPVLPAVIEGINEQENPFEKLLGKLESVTMDNISQTASEWFDDFEHVSERYILTSVAAFGILMNFVAIMIISWDRRIWPMSRILHNIFLFSEQIFLALVIAYLQMKAYFHRNDWRRLEPLNYLTTFVGAAQTFAAWMLYVLATDAYRSVRQLTTSEKIFQIRRAPGYVVFLILVVGGFYCAYLPPVRVEFYKFVNGTDYNLCNVPIENHWNFTYDEVPNTDLYYILYYSVGYTLFAYVFPFFMICCRNKDIIDILHEAQEQKTLLPSRAYVLCPALAVSVACNVYLVCVALKMVILTFKVFEFVDDYVKGAFVFFRYLNVYSNFLQVLKSSLHFFILMIYNKRLRNIVLMAMRKKCAKK